MQRTVRVVTTAVVFMIGGMATVQAGNPFNGREPYAKHCAGCHGDRGESKLIGVPNFSHGDVIISSTDGMLMNSIKNGKGLMPGFHGQIKDTEILDIIAYIRTMF